MNRKTSLKNWIKKLADENAISKKDIVPIAGRAGGYKTVRSRKPIKKVSRSKRKQYGEYFRKTKEFLANNPACLICVTRGEKPNPATEVHHVYLRAGRKLLLDERGWLPSCRKCREYPHLHAGRAVKDGILATAPSRNSWTSLDQDAKSGHLPEMLYLTKVNSSSNGVDISE